MESKSDHRAYNGREQGSTKSVSFFGTYTRTRPDCGNDSKCLELGKHEEYDDLTGLSKTHSYQASYWQFPATEIKGMRNMAPTSPYPELHAFFSDFFTINTVTSSKPGTSSSSSSIKQDLLYKIIRYQHLTGADTFGIQPFLLVGASTYDAYHVQTFGRRRIHDNQRRMKIPEMSALMKSD